MKRFELSYRDKADGVHFVVVYDENVESACERVLGRPVDPNEIKQSLLGNRFITGWENTLFTIFEGEGPIGSSVSFIPAALYIRKDDKVNVVNSILEGLI